MPTNPVRTEAEKNHFTVKEIAFVLGRTPKSIQRRIRKKEIRVLPLGAPYLIPVSEYNRLTCAE